MNNSSWTPWGMGRPVCCFHIKGLLRTSSCDFFFFLSLETNELDLWEAATVTLRNLAHIWDWVRNPNTYQVHQRQFSRTMKIILLSLERALSLPSLVGPPIPTHPTQNWAPHVLPVPLLLPTPVRSYL